MARIKKCGELEFFFPFQTGRTCIDEETGEDFEQPIWVIVCRLFLDQPIKITGQIYKRYLDFNKKIDRECGRETDFYHWYFPNVTINRGQMINSDAFQRKLVGDCCPDSKFEMDPENVLDSVDLIIFRRLLPKDVVKALLGQKTYSDIELTLYADLRRPESDHCCDLQISIILTEKVKNTDKFLQALALKLNRWLAKTR